MMKNATQMHDVPQGAPEEVRQAYGILEKHRWTREERLAYEQAKIALMDEIDAMRTSKEEGKEEERLEIARRMIKKGLSLEEVCELTKLKMDIVQQLSTEAASDPI